MFLNVLKWFLRKKFLSTYRYKQGMEAATLASIYINSKHFL
jgi:hypothetical protein